MVAVPNCQDVFLLPHGCESNLAATLIDTTLPMYPCVRQRISILSQNFMNVYRLVTTSTVVMIFRRLFEN